MDILWPSRKVSYGADSGMSESVVWMNVQTVLPAWYKDEVKTANKGRAGPGDVHPKDVVEPG